MSAVDVVLVTVYAVETIGIVAVLAWVVYVLLRYLEEGDQQ